MVPFMTLLCWSIGGCAQRSGKIDRTTVNDYQVERFMGTWYELARFDHPFEREMTEVSATYTLNPDGTITVENRGMKRGRAKVIRGKARIRDPHRKGELRVSFFPLISSDYNILELDLDGYTYALIGSSSPRYLWIMSRQRTLPRATFNRLLRCAKQRGYDIDALLFVDQNAQGLMLGENDTPSPAAPADSERTVTFR